MAALRPWWDIFPKTPTKLIERTIEEPGITPAGGLFGTTKKTVVKHITKGGWKYLLAGGAGAGLVAFLFGGKGQEQEAEQRTTVTPTQESRLEQLLRQQAKMTGRVEAYLDLMKLQYARAAGGRAGAAIEGWNIEDFTGDITFKPTTITGATGGQVSQLQYDQILTGMFQLMAAQQQAQQVPTQVTTVTPSLTQTQASADMGLLALAAVAAIILLGGKK